MGEERDSRLTNASQPAYGQTLDRRTLLRRAGAAGVALGVAPWIATSSAFASARPVKIGYVTPRTGALADFGQCDTFTIAQMQKLFAKGIKVGGSVHPLEIYAQDAQSSSSRAGMVAQNLITAHQIDLMLVEGTPDITNPVCDICEASSVPCISSVAPWQAWFFGRNGNPKVPFKWTYHFFWGLGDIINVFLDIWKQVPNNKVVGALWPNDADGNAWASPTTGFPPADKAAGYTIVDPGRYADGTMDFSSQLSEFKSKNCEIVTGVPIPPDFTTFWEQALQQGFRPKIASVGKALLFPAAVDALGSHGNGMSTELWWSPGHPYHSSLTGQSCAQLSAEWEKSNGEWTQPLGFTHAMFEIAANVLSRTANLDSNTDIINAIKATKLNTIVGNIDWSTGPLPNVALTKLAGAQWRPGKTYKYELEVVTSTMVPGLKTTAKVIPIPYS